MDLQTLPLPGIPQHPGLERSLVEALDRERIERVVGLDAAEVMLKVRRGGKSDEHVCKHLMYISRDGKIKTENERGEIVEGKQAVRLLADEWEAAPCSGRPDTSRTINLILSMPAGTDPDSVLAAGRSFARERLSDHQFVLVLHTPENDPDPDPPAHPHVHISVLAYGFNGRRLNPLKAHLREWREDFARRLRTLGVAAEATPRRTRGIVRKATKTPEWHIERRMGADAMGPASKARQGRMTQIAEEFREGRLELQPWEQRTQEAQAQVRNQWLALARHFKSTGDAADAQLAVRIGQFVERMPAVETERMAMRRRLERGEPLSDAFRASASPLPGADDEA